MKKLLSLLSVILLAVAGINAQSPAPGILNYQGVARNSVGNVLVNKSISLRLTIRDGSAAGPAVYSETRQVTTNPFGLFNVQLGGPGASGVTGSIAGAPWGVGLKFIQVEIDPNGGSTFINIGTAQLASVPYSLYSSLSNDLVLPFNKTQADAGSLFRVTNSGTGSGSTALEGLTNSTAGNVSAVIGTVSNTAPGGFSAGVRGINNGTSGLGIGVYGSQNGSGWGVYGTTPSGIGVHGLSNSGFGVYGLSNSGTGVYGNSTTGFGGLFEVTNASSTADALRATTAGTGASWAIRGISSGTNGAGLFQQTNATNTSNNLQSNQAGLGRAGLFNITNAASTANTVEANTNGSGSALVGNKTATNGTLPAVLGTSASTDGNAVAVQGIISSTTPGGFSTGVRGINNGTGGLGIGVWGSQAGSGWGVYGTANGGIGVNGSASSGIGVNGTSNTGIGGRFTTTSGLALYTTGGVRLEGIGEAANRVLTSDASGNATWVALGGGVGIGGSGTLNFVSKWTPDGTNLGNSLLFDDGTSVGLGTTTPTHRFDVTHGGSTGIGINSTSGFSVLDINAASGDAAIRLANAGVNQWNIRNRPADNYLEIFELGGGGSRVVIQDATGNVGIGETANPTYKLDVLHGGSTGIRSRSSGSFSVVDIDAASGDAALRFAKAGVNQWNTRNRPADDYYEIFELGGGGSRFVIQDATGNVGIGETTNPTYKLDVLHGGSTGIRSRSSGSFSVIDIDAASGDAALRFANNGVNQWNTRNRPADDYYEIFELGGGGSRVVIQDGTGNVGIGETANPTYKLDVLHGGATGIRSRSSGTFSLMDIDAANGDAALRFAKAGVNQWNTRNRPADDYYEIFELGGGGSRFVIQDGTGNVGIGETTNPTYKLDVLHGGATGIRSRSSGTFSVIDIDADNGDAALRFAKAGVNQWNTRNNPGTDDYQIFELGGGGERMRIDNTTGHVWVNNDFDVLGAKNFAMDHPLDPANKILRHAAAESNEVINFYSGNITTDASGKAVVSLPDYFEALNKDPRYQLTVIGSFAQAIISKEVAGNKFEISTSIPNVKVSWEVKGVRNDARFRMFPYVAEEEKSAAQKGKYLDPIVHNQPMSKHVTYDASIESSLNDAPKATYKPAPATTGGSLDQAPVVAPAANKPAEKGGSTEDVPATKSTKAAPESKGGSLDEMPKPAENNKKVEVKVKGGSTQGE